MILTAFYDLAYGPVSFDFVTFLVRAMRERDARKCAGLHVVIVPKEDGLGGFSRHWGKHDEHAARWRLWHIVMASCPLAGATVTLAPSRDAAGRMIEDGEKDWWWPEGKAHFMGPLVDASRKGESIPKLRATEAARRYVDEMLGPNGARHLGPAGSPLVTFTLRQQNTDPARNSALSDWGRLHALVRERGFRTVWMEDVHVALGKGEAFQLDPDLRLALYEQASMNLIGNNGPQELLKFSEAPYLVFNLGIESWRGHFRKYFCMEFGEQLPWAGKHQRLVYEPDTFDVMRREFEKWAGETSFS